MSDALIHAMSFTPAIQKADVGGNLSDRPQTIDVLHRLHCIHAQTASIAGASKA
jgi:hypothetical protein